MTDNIPGKTAKKQPAKKPKAEMSSTEYLDMTSANASSAGDMTGLIPAAPVSGHELDNYNALYTHDPATRERGRKKAFDK